jgi:hypothetical protein
MSSEKIFLVDKELAWQNSRGTFLLTMCTTMKKLELLWAKLKVVTTDGRTSMNGEKTDLIGRTM